MNELTDLTDVGPLKLKVCTKARDNKWNRKPEQGQYKKTTEAKNPEMAVSV